MQAHTYTRVHTTLRLGKEEEFLAYSDGNQYPFFVNQITFSGGEWVELSGPAMTGKGRGLINRTCARKVLKLRENYPEMTDAIMASHIQAIEELAKGNEDD